MLLLIYVDFLFMPILLIFADYFSSLFDAAAIMMFSLLLFWLR